MIAAIVVLAAVLAGIIFLNVWLCCRRKRAAHKAATRALTSGLLDLVTPETRNRHSFPRESSDCESGGWGPELSHVVDFSSSGAVIPFSELSIGEKIGMGSSGAVMRASWRGTPCAVKRLNAALADQTFCDEISLLRELRHPQIIQFLGASHQTPDWHIVTEFAERGSLEGVLQDGRIDLPLLRRVDMARDAATGLNFLHLSGIIHRDLKSANLLVTADWRIKIGDFGLSRHIDHATITLGPAGTPAWSAPEVLRGDKYELSADVYSYGVCLWELTTRKTPFEGVVSTKVLMSVCQGMRPVVPLETGAELSRLITDCWHGIARQRPTFSNVLERLDSVQAEAQAAAEAEAAAAARG